MPSVLLVREVNEAGRRPHTCSRSCAFEEKKRRKRKKTRRIPNTPRNSHAARRARPPPNGVLLNTSHALAHTFTIPYISGLWKLASYSSRNQLNKECDTDTQTDAIDNGTLYAPRYEEVFLPKAKRPHHQLASVVDTGFSALKSKLFQEYYCGY